MSNKLSQNDLKFFYFRLPEQPVHESPVGVMVMHLPSGQSATSQAHKHRIDNKREAANALLAKLNIPAAEWEKIGTCSACGQPFVQQLDGWSIFHAYSLEGNGVSLQVYSAKEGEETLWTWSGTIDDEETDGDLYETAEGAALAAQAWVSSIVGSSDQDKQGDGETAEPADGEVPA
jgi:hypothetical protein